MRPTLLIATTNPGKLAEIRQLLGNISIDLLTLADVPPLAAPEETGATFEENARLKAAYYASHTGHITAAEDSGLVIDALGGDPGVRSARFLRDDASYPERFAEISRRLAQQPGARRTARFVCALAVARGDDIVFETTQAVEGEIAAQPSGNGGFGYDPIFFYPPYGRTLADVSRDEKLSVAHRGKAFRVLADRLADSPALLQS
jgi:XTP/dITP diphosphohydrolase